MGYYLGQRENPCPRCGGIVYTTFISVTPMSFFQKCSGCKTETFTEEEEELLGDNTSGLEIEFFEEVKHVIP
jgi:hypothetical protein